MSTTVHTSSTSGAPIDMGLLARAKRYLGQRLSPLEQAQLEYDIEEKKHHVQPLLRQHSDAAYVQIQPKKQTIKSQVVEFIKSREALGATTAEVLEAFPHIKFQSLAPRVTELHQDGITIMQGSRLTSSGLSAAVWVINPEVTV